MLMVEDLVVPSPAEPCEPGLPTWPVEPLLLAAAAPRSGRARPVLRPVLWVLAVLYLVADVSGRCLGRVLDGYVRTTDAAGRALRRAGVAVLRRLGPLGRLLRRLADPVVRLLVRCWDRVSVWLLLRMFRPLHRWAQALWARCAPFVERLWDQVQRLVRRVEPVLTALAAAVDAVEAAAARLADRWHRAWAPVVRLAHSLRGRSRG